MLCIYSSLHAVYSIVCIPISREAVVAYRQTYTEQHLVATFALFQSNCFQKATSFFMLLPTEHSAYA